MQGLLSPPEISRGKWVQRSRSWHPGVWPRRLPPIVMFSAYFDESHDANAYALAGWIAYPEEWDVLTPIWQQFLDTTTMPDGSSMPAFHAAEIVGRDQISDSRFRGWSFDQEKDAFKKAVSILNGDKSVGFVQPIGCCLVVPQKLDWVEDQDTIWILLFGCLFQMLFFRLKGSQPDGYSFMFDCKREVRSLVNGMWDEAMSIVRKHSDTHNKELASLFKNSTVAFGSDEANPPLQMADLWAYEWRRRVSEIRSEPTKIPRTSYRLLKEAHTNRLMRCYGEHAVEEIKKRCESDRSRIVELMLDYPTTEE